MDILDSLELRWFLRPDARATAVLQQWFESASEEGARVDHYLLTGRHDLGFKARMVAGQPAKVETKFMVGSLGTVDLAPALSGELQRWTKLSLELDDPNLRKDGAWLAVTKARRLRKYAVELSTAAASEVAIKERPDVGCGVELTRLEYTRSATAETEWTFGLEAFGPSQRLLDVMRCTCLAIAKGSTMPEMGAEWSASYADWLLSRISDGRVASGTGV